MGLGLVDGWQAPVSCLCLQRRFPRVPDPSNPMCTTHLRPHLDAAALWLPLPPKTADHRTATGRYDWWKGVPSSWCSNSAHPLPALHRLTLLAAVRTPTHYPFVLSSPSNATLHSRPYLWQSGKRRFGRSAMGASGPQQPIQFEAHCIIGNPVQRLRPHVRLTTYVPVTTETQLVRRVHHVSWLSSLCQRLIGVHIVNSGCEIQEAQV